MDGAVIDIGTNSVRLLCASLQDGRLVLLARDLTTTRLGLGVHNTGLLSPDAMKRTVSAVVAMTTMARRCGVQRIWLIGTSALRDASNRQEFCDDCRVRSGLDVEIISGEQEAAFSYGGAVHTLATAGERIVVMDIGGGSTELISGLGGQIDKAVSTQIGAVRLTEMFAPSGSWDQVRIGACRRYVHETLAACGALPSGTRLLLGVGGTLTSLAAIELGLQVYDPQQIQGHVLRFDTVNKQFEQLVAMTVDQRRNVVGLQPQRADIMPAGVLIACIAMEMLGATALTVSESDLLTGALLHKWATV